MLDIRIMRESYLYDDVCACESAMSDDETRDETRREREEIVSTTEQSDPQSQRAVVVKQGRRGIIGPKTMRMRCKTEEKSNMARARGE